MTSREEFHRKRRLLAYCVERRCHLFQRLKDRISHARGSFLLCFHFLPSLFHHRILSLLCLDFRIVRRGQSSKIRWGRTVEQATPFRLAWERALSSRRPHGRVRDISERHLAECRSRAVRPMSPAFVSQSRIFVERALTRDRESWRAIPRRGVAIELGRTAIMRMRMPLDDRVSVIRIVGRVVQSRSNLSGKVRLARCNRSRQRRRGWSSVIWGMMIVVLLMIVRVRRMRTRKRSHVACVARVSLVGATTTGGTVFDSVIST